MLKPLAVALVLTAAAGAARAQGVRTPIPPVPMLEGQAEVVKLQEAMVAAHDAATDAAGDGGAAARGDRLDESAHADHAGADAEPTRVDAGGDEELCVDDWSDGPQSRIVPRHHPGVSRRRSATVRLPMHLV